jgi:hypothetical protein
MKLIFYWVTLIYTGLRAMTAVRIVFVFFFSIFSHLSIEILNISEENIKKFYQIENISAFTFRVLKFETACQKSKAQFSHLKGAVCDFLFTTTLEEFGRHLCFEKMDSLE